METAQEKKKNNKKKKKHRNKNKNKKKNNIQEEMNKEIKNEEKKEEPKEEEKNIEKDLKIENIKEKYLKIKSMVIKNDINSLRNEFISELGNQKVQNKKEIKKKRIYY